MLVGRQAGERTGADMGSQPGRKEAWETARATELCALFPQQLEAPTHRETPCSCSWGQGDPASHTAHSHATHPMHTWPHSCLSPSLAGAQVGLSGGHGSCGGTGSFHTPHIPAASITATAFLLGLHCRPVGGQPRCLPAGSDSTSSSALALSSASQSTRRPSEAPAVRR